MGFDRLLLVRLLMSLVTLGYGVVTVKADFNKTHATNPLWTGHARFHLVWQITSYLGFAVLALAPRAVCSRAPVSCRRLCGHRVWRVLHNAPDHAAL
jgi:hypothetical protein